MDNASTPDMGDAAVTTSMTPSTSTTSSIPFDFSHTITPADFAPTCRPHPRPWNRVPVPAASVYITLRKIWKRVGALPLSSNHARYLKTAAELQADGNGPRKVPRTLLHVPVFGDATWAEASTENVSVTVDDMPAATTTSHELSRSSRKRNSKRQPITPTQRAAPASAPASPPAPASPAPETTEHITKRAKRRMSRRISILPQPEIDSASPVKQTATTPAPKSPTKRRVSFFILDSELPMAGASPTKKISPSAPFEPVLSSPVKAAATESPTKLDSVTEESDDTPSTQPHVVVFTQPTAEIEAESPQQVRRRVALNNTRRRETWFATTDAFDFSTAAAEPKSKSRSSRRHSFLPGQEMPAHKPLVFESTAPESRTKSKASSRRHTFQPGAMAGLFSTADFTSFSASKDTVPEISVSDESDDTTSTVQVGPTQDETVVVDARTNLDIFGSGPPLQAHSASVDRRVSLDLESQIKSDEAKPTETDPTHLAPESAETTKTEAKPIETVEVSEIVVAKAVPLSILEEDATEFSNNSTPRDMSPDMDTMTTDSSREITDEQSLVSRKRTSLALDESLLLPLPDTTGTETIDTDVEIEDFVDADVDADANIEVDLDATPQKKPVQSDDGWQSPTAAELDLMADLLDTPSQPEPVDMSISPVMPTQLELDVELPTNNLDDYAMDDVEGDADEIEDDFNEIVEDEVSMSPKGSPAAVAESKVQFETQVEQIEAPLSSDNASPSDDDDDDELDLEQVDYTVTQPIHMLQSVNDEVTMTTSMDLDALVEEQLSSHDDSETEMLRKFVTRVKADKSAKAKAAAAAAASTDSDFTTAAIRARNTLHPKRRSGSMGSTASASGSPIAKKENKDAAFEKINSNSIFASPFKSLDPSRTPLGMKDSNMSPSPRKKRKELSSGVNFFNDEKHSLRAGHVDLLSKPSFDDHSPPRQKRRRKKMEADTGSIFNPEFMSSSKDKDSSKAGNESSEKDEEQSGPRRSKRTRSNQTPVKSLTSSSATAGTSANGVLSLIPVRLPGSLNLNGEDSYGLSATNNTSLGARRNDEKDLATMTRVNTRKNKSGSDPPSVVIQRLSQERAQEKWRAMVEKREQREQREREGGGDFTLTDPTLTQKSVFDSPLRAEANDETSAPKSRKSSKKHASATASKSSKGKSVRWAEVLARFQESPSTSEEAILGDAAAVPVDGKAAEATEPAAEITAPVEATAPAPTPAVSSAPIPAVAAPETEKKSIPRRTTRVSRLPPPTPSKVIASAAAAKAAASSASTASTETPGLKAPRMATRRAKIVGLGLAANGTPAPKRRTTRTT